MSTGSNEDAVDYQALFDHIPYWFHQIEVAPGIFTPGIDDTADKITWCELPKDLSGASVLDIGCYEGGFSFECERRGATVTAVDLPTPGSNGFETCRALLGSKVEYRQASVYELNPRDFGTYDLVLFLGVLYHLKHPLLALERIHTVCSGRLVVESQICDAWFIDSEGDPRTLQDLAPGLVDCAIAQFYPGTELGGDPSNWWSPNTPALLGMLRASGFEPDHIISKGSRACVHAQRLDQTMAETPLIF